MGYIILNIFLLTIMLCSFILLKLKNSKPLLMLPIATLTVSLVMFFAYVYGLYGEKHTDGIPITFVMRIFMPDDNVTNSNIVTGYVTSLFLVAICIIYTIIFVSKYKGKSRY